MKKRTKLYGGFLVGDRVQRNDGVFNQLSSGIVTGMRYGFIYTKWTDLNGKDFGAIFSPNQLINLTRQEEEEQILHEKTQKIKSLQEHIDEQFNKYFPWIDKEKQKQIEDVEELLGLNKRCTFPFLYIKNPKTISQDDFMKDFKPTPFEDLTTGTFEEREEKLRKLAEQEICETYGVDKILDNPALEESRENMDNVSEETANELNDRLEKGKVFLSTPYDLTIQGYMRNCQFYSLYFRKFSSTLDY